MAANTRLLSFYKKNPYVGVIAVFVSFFLHITLLFLIAYLLNTTEIKTLTADSEEPPPINVTLDPPQQPKKEEKTQKEPEKSRVLTTDQPESDNIVPSEPEKPSELPNKSHDLEKFFPRSNPEYLKKLREQAERPKQIEGDSGDIPIRGQERRRDVPMIVERFDHKDLSLFQFSKMFHDRFGSVWNSKERWVPPESPLRPGDVVYYKVYINPDGTLDHIENLTNQMKPDLNTEALDKTFEEVLTQTLPMKLPARLEKNVQVTEVVAVQVVNKTLFMNFGR